VCWVASLFLSCLGVGWSIGEAIAGMMGQTGIPVETKCILVWDYGFPVSLGNPAMAVVCSIWHSSMVEVGGCIAHMAGLLLGWAACQVVSCGAVKSFGEPCCIECIESSLVGGGSCALCYSRHDFQYQV